MTNDIQLILHFWTIHLACTFLFILLTYFFLWLYFLRSTSQTPGVSIFSKLIKLKKTSIFTAVWVFISSIAAKSIIEDISHFLKTDLRLHYQVYFEEPCLSLNSSYCNEFDVIFSGLHLTCKQKEFFLRKGLDQDQYIYITCLWIGLSLLNYMKYRNCFV